MGRCAIIGGGGRLPVALAERRDDAVLRHPEGVAFGDGSLSAVPFRVERLGALWAELRAEGVDEVVFAGAMRRPALDPSAFDAETAAAAPRLLTAMQAGDDATLRAVVALFEEQGFVVRAAHEVVPELLPAVGVPTKAAPSERDRADAARGAEVVAALGAVDVGQGCIVAQGQVLAVEALPGTDWMLATLAERAGPWRPDTGRGAGVLVKAPKPGQDRRVDLPAIGPETVAGAARAGLAGIAVEADGVMLLDAAEAVRLADAAGLFLWVREA